MQTGVVDGAENNEPSYESGQHYRYAKYYSKTGHLMIPEILVFSKRTWDNAVEGRSGADHEARQGGADRSSASSGTSARRSRSKKMKEAGVEINEVADKKPFQDAVKPVWDKYGAAAQALIERIQDVK